MLAHLRFSAVLFMSVVAAVPVRAQKDAVQMRPEDVTELLSRGYTAADLSDLVVRDHYVSHGGALGHSFFRQRHAGIEVHNGDIAVHRKADGQRIALHAEAVKQLENRVKATEPRSTPQQAVEQVLGGDGFNAPIGRTGEREPDRMRWNFGEMEGLTGPLTAQLMYLVVNDDVVLVWEVEYQRADGRHWWQVRIDAVSGKEVQREDRFTDCGFHTGADVCHDAVSEAPAPPAGPNDLRVYGWPVESPNHGARSLRNAPWNSALNASPFGWNDTNGAPGAEFQITRGNNAHAQEDANGNNGTGYSPSGGAGLDFDFPINLAQAPSTYQDAAITNLFYWNNLMHDVWYQYGFDEASGNFQANNYGSGGLGNDHVLADAQDGSGTNNANFATPPDGSNPRMQMFLWTGAPMIDSDLDNGIIAHEYGHGISNRLVGGPSNTNCLTNAEQMGEGWSDFFSLVMTMEPGDTGPDARGMGTFADGQPANGPGLRPSPYSTDLGVNAYTYGNTNAGVSQPHGIGFVWCTMLWDLTWALIDQYGYDPDPYNGNGGNNIAMQLVIDGMKLTPCGPGFVDARDAILQADQLLYGGANQMLIWTAFAQRGLGFSASQGSPGSRSDQVEAFDIPVTVNGVCAQIVAPTNAPLGACGPVGPIAVKARFANGGTQPLVGLPVRYRLDAGPTVAETIAGALAPGDDTLFTFATTLPAPSVGLHALRVWCAAAGEGALFNDTLTAQFEVLQSNGSMELLLKPGPLEGKDAFVWWLTTQAGQYGPTNSTNYGTHQNYNAMEWTWSGSPGRRYGLIDFDLSVLPPGSDIHHAALSLYQNPNSGDGLHSSQSGSNASVLQRISGPWNESTVTWNNRPPVVSADQVVLAQSTSPTQDYLGIDVTGMVAAMVLDTATGHGFQLSTITPQHYRKMVFASSDHPDPLKWPELKVCYTPPARVELSVVLDGPWTNGSVLMNDSLRTRNLIPLTEPYTGLGFVNAGSGGGETIDASVLATTGPNAVVDWVHLALSSSTSQSDMIASRCALLQRDGDVVDLDGVSPVVFHANEGFHHVIVRHRNHLGVVTAQPVFLSTTQIGQIDLTGPLPIAYGINAQKTEGGKLVLWAGDVNSSGVLKYTGLNNDRDPILQAIGGTVPTNVVTGYSGADVNMDGDIRYTGAANDRDPILLNIGGVVPTATRPAQIP